MQGDRIAREEWKRVGRRKDRREISDRNERRRNNKSGREFYKKET